MQQKQILILYSELAEYALACLRELGKQGCEIHLVAWPVNPEAPFHFDAASFASFENRKHHGSASLLAHAKKIRPDMIVCSGWMDKAYVEVSKAFCNTIPVVLTMDNKWEGRLKQRIATIISPFTIRRSFNRAWVPGKPQKIYAGKLGFPEQHIYTGFYSADTSHFDRVHEEISPLKKAAFPKKLLYMGRYVKHKGIFDLWQAFSELSAEFPEWELHCCGTGDQWESRMQHPKIFHHGFVQPKDLQPILQQTGIYILPSHEEPWGVSLHEMAVAGFPLIASEQVGASEVFLQHGVNGYHFEPGNVPQLKESMKKLMSVPVGKLLEMGSKSHQLGMQVAPWRWSETAMRILRSW